MPAIQNVERRGAVYYWRRTVRFQDGKPFTLRLSLRTTDQAAARRMGNALTAESETLKMKLSNSRAAGLTFMQKAELYREGLEAERDHLDRSHVLWQRTDPEDATNMIEGYVELLEAMLKDLIVHGLPSNAGSREHVEERLGELSEEQKNSIVEFFEMSPDPKKAWSDRARDDVMRFDVDATEDNVAIARKIRMEGRLSAVQEFRKRLAEPAALWSQFAHGGSNLHRSTAQVSAAVGQSDMVIEEPWASMTPLQAAARFEEDNPKITGDAKRKARWVEKTFTQFMSAVGLLEKSYGAKPFRLITQADIAILNKYFTRLPISHHKTPRHDAMTLEEICVEAKARVEAKEMSKDKIGLGATTTNRHFNFLRELTTWFSRQVPGMDDIDWSVFIYQDRRDARKQKDAYTEEEGRAFFSLPIWSGSQSLKRRMISGSTVYHDAGFWVPLIAWYTGSRREEICQLTLADIHESDGIWYFTITDENGGRVKNEISKRDVPFADELVRLGLAEYVQALRRAGERMLFPELRTEANNRSYGDVFAKLWWAKIASRLDFVKPGQALHSFRHMVTTELKFQEVFLETRADLVGHTLPGETAGRYSKSARLSMLKRAVDQIPKVTEHIRPHPIRLLPPQDRKPRKMRIKAAAPGKE